MFLSVIFCVIFVATSSFAPGYAAGKQKVLIYICICMQLCFKEMIILFLFFFFFFFFLFFFSN